MDNHTQLPFDYQTFFKSIYYKLYSNSNTSRAERIVSDITKILLCRLISEQEDIQNIAEYSGTQLLDLLRQKYPQSCEKYEDFSLDDNAVQTAMNCLNHISLVNAPSHIIGDAFQAIIGSGIRGDKGQFFTPKELVECMVRVVNIKSGSVIIDIKMPRLIQFNYSYSCKVA